MTTAPQPDSTASQTAPALVPSPAAASPALPSTASSTTSSTTLQTAPKAGSTLAVPQNGVNLESTMPRNSPEMAPEGPIMFRLDTLLGEWEKEALESHAAYKSGRPRGPVSGLKALDQSLGGSLAPGLHILHGQPGTGKTALGLQIAATCGVPALMVTCEMSALELLRRHTARVTGTYLGRLKDGELEPHKSLELARRAVAAAPDLLFIDATRAAAPYSFLRECAFIVRDSVEPETACPAPFLIVLDSLHAWVEGAWPGVPEYEALNFGLAHLRRLAHEVNVPLLLLCERNRESMKSGGQSAGAGTRKIEYGAETVIELESDPGLHPNVNGSKMVSVRLSKNRHGGAGKRIEMLFNGALQTFTLAD